MLLRQHKLIGILVVSLILIPACGDQDGEDPKRYKDVMFTGYETTDRVQYGLDPEVHWLKVFEPSGDTETKRPLVIYVPGGGFREVFHWDYIPGEFTRYGYVAADMHYRLGNLPLDAPTPTAYDYLHAAVQVVNDIRSAIQYFRADAAGPNQFGIDPDRIFILGFSAGAIASLTSAFLDADDEVAPLFQQAIDAVDPSTMYPDQDATIAGVVAVGGAVFDLEYIDEGESPVFCLHGENDNAVSPAGLRVIKYDGSYELSGSYKIIPKAEDEGIFSQLRIITGGAHNAPLDPDACPTCYDAMAEFMYEVSNQ